MQPISFVNYGSLFLFRNCITCEMVGDISISALLWVDDPPAYYVEHLRNLDATERDNVVFECRLSRPNAEVEWMIGNELLQETDRVIFLSDDVFRRLLVDDVRMDEAGEYTNHIVGQDTRCSANLTVTGKIAFTQLRLTY